MMKLKGKEKEDYGMDCRYFREFKGSTSTRLSINILDEVGGKPHISKVLVDWSREDYLRAIRIADKVKEMLLDINMDMIQYPNDFVCENGETFLDILRTPIRGVSQDKEYADIVINSNIIINPETRTFKHMNSLRDIIHSGQIELTSENIGVIELGKQTYSEQKNIKAKKDELSRRNMMIQKKINTIDI